MKFGSFLPAKAQVWAVVMLAISVGRVAFAASITGPSSSQSPYLVEYDASGVTFVSILTTGDTPTAGDSLKKGDKKGKSVADSTVTPYRMVGIPDGLGAFDNDDGTFTLLMNHEFGPTSGVVRKHGGKGAFVSKWIIRKKDMMVLSGEDLIQTVYLWNVDNASYQVGNNVAFGRLCSADLPAVSAYYDKATKLGYKERIFMNGEEFGIEARPFAHLLTGVSYQLPRLGRTSFENALANPAGGINTIVALNDDLQAGQIYIYIGKKQKYAEGVLPIEAAGLTNGKLYGVKVIGSSTEDPTTGIPPGRFILQELGTNGDVSNLGRQQIDAQCRSTGVTAFNRPEDGAWDPSNPNDYYFVTTASFNGRSRLWRLRFDSLVFPTIGGTIEMMLDGTEGQKMMDNVAINDDEEIIICEDPGNEAYLAKVLKFDIATKKLTPIGQHDPDRFGNTTSPYFITIDEESSGVIDVSDILGEGWYLITVQAHKLSTDTELVEGGQLLGLYIPPTHKKPGPKGH